MFLVSEFHKVSLPKINILIQNAKYKTIIEKNQLQFTELQEEIRNLKLENKKLNERLSATESESLNLKKERTYNEMEFHLSEQRMTGGEMPWLYGTQDEPELISTGIFDMDEGDEGVATAPNKSTAKSTGLRNSNL